MADIEKLPLEDVRYFAQQLLHSYGGLAELAQKHPWIREYSQEVVREIYGDEFNVWRYLTVKGKQDIKPEKIVSLTGNPAWIFYATATAPSGYWGTDPLTGQTSMMIIEHAILKYRLTPDRVVFYVPAIINAARDMFGDSLKKWIAKKSRDYPMSISKVFTRITRDAEEEIVADVSGLTPEVIDFRIKGDDVWWWNKTLVGDIAGDRALSPEAFIDELIKEQRVTVDAEWPRERMVDYMTKLYERLIEFFAP